MLVGLYIYVLRFFVPQGAASLGQYSTVHLE